MQKATYKSLRKTKKSPEEIKERALEAFREQAVQYNVVITNCEHFATWCVYGRKVSSNIRVVAIVSAVATTTLAGAGTGVLGGAAIGSVVPVVGTAAGGFIGGICGAIAGLAGGATASGITTVIVHSKTEETKKF